jgi:hypothetical protein
MAHTHFVSPTCKGERCRCGNEATHKVGEEIPPDEPNTNGPAWNGIPDRHNFTAYVCCACFAQLFGRAVFCGPERDFRGGDGWVLLRLG